MKILPEMCLLTRKKWLNLGSHSPVDLNLGISWGILQHCKIGHFCTVWLICPAKLIRSLWKFCRSCSVTLENEVPVKFLKLSGSGFAMRTGFTLAEVRVLRLLLWHWSLVSLSCILVNKQFKFLPVSYLIDIRTAKFLEKFTSSENLICSLFAKQATADSMQNILKIR